MNCYLCHAPSLEVIREKVRHDLRRNVLECGSCGLVYLEPNDESLEDYYAEDYRKKHSPVVGKALGSREIFETYRPYQPRRVERLRPFLAPDVRLLDVGSSAGHFLHAVQNEVGECVGVELNREEALFANEELGIHTVSEPLARCNLPRSSFDLITAFHVMEHVADPVGFARTIREFLAPGGHVYIEVPNIDDALLSLYSVDAYADFWYRAPHLFNFSADTLTRVMREAGFEGEVSSLQRYSVLNHFHWLTTGEPQDSIHDGMASARFFEPNDVSSPAQRDLNEWIRQADAAYRTLLVKHGHGDSIAFVGRALGDGE